MDHILRIPVIAAFTALALAAAPASAKNTISQAFSCAKDVEKTGELAAKNSVKIGQLAESRPECVSKAVGQDYLLFGVTGAVALLQSQYPGKIKIGSCETSLRNTLAEPFAKAIGGVVPAPAGEMVTDYLENNGAAAVWDFLSATPPIDIFMIEVSCGCAFVDAGINVQEVKATLEANLKAAKSCSAIVTQSCKDMAAVSSAAAEFCLGALDFAGDAVKESAKAVSDGVISVGEFIGGQTDAMPVDKYYQTWFKPYVLKAGEEKAMNPAFDWRNYAFFSQTMGSSINNSGNDWMNACRGYFDGHKYSKANANKVCDIIAGWMDGEVNARGAMLKARLDLKAAWAAEKAKQTAHWLPLCGGNYQCPISVKSHIGDYEDNKFNQGPWEYKSWGMFGKMRKALDATGDVQAAIAIGAASARADLVNDVAAGNRPSANMDYLCFPAGNGKDCKKALVGLEAGCLATMKAIAAKPDASVAQLAVASAKCKTSYAAYVYNGWGTYVNTQFATCAKQCPAGGKFHQECTDMVGSTTKTAMNEVNTKLKASAAPLISVVTQELHRCTVQTQVDGDRKKKEDAYYAKWSAQCPKSTGPRPVTQAVSACESKLRAAFEACGDRFFEDCTDKGAKVALAEAAKEAAQDKAKNDERMAQQVKEQGAHLNSAQVGAIAAGPTPKTVIPVGSSATTPPKATQPVNATTAGSTLAHAAGTQVAKPASILAPPSGPLKPLLDAGCKTSPGDPLGFLCPSPAMPRCELFKRDGKVRSCALQH